MVMRWLVLLWGVARACPASDGSPAAPFYVDYTFIGVVLGSSCAPFPSLEVALLASSEQAAATISLLSSASLTTWNLTSAITVLVNSNILELAGTVTVSGELKIYDGILTSNSSSDFVLDVAGTLLLENCTVTGFSTLPVKIRG